MSHTRARRCRRGTSSRRGWRASSASNRRRWGKGWADPRSTWPPLWSAEGVFPHVVASCVQQGVSMPRDAVVFLDRLNTYRADQLVVIEVLRVNARDRLRGHVLKRSLRLGFFLAALVALGVVLPLTHPVAPLAGTDRGTADRAQLVAASVESLLAASHDHVIRAQPIAAPGTGRRSPIDSRRITPTARWKNFSHPGWEIFPAVRQ